MLSHYMYAFWSKWKNISPQWEIKPNSALAALENSAFKRPRTNCKSLSALQTVMELASFRASETV